MTRILVEHRKYFWKAETGASLVEYAVLLALIAIVTTALVSATGYTFAQVFDSFNERLQNAWGTP